VTTITVTFGSPATQATAILTGSLIEYSRANDHHLGQLDVEVSVPANGINGASVTVNVTHCLREWSGNWDDQYDGTISFL
jgi:hypothetical protein